MKNKSLFVLIILCIVSKTTMQGQESLGKESSIVTAAPFMLIISDARAAGMGDIGVSTSSDASSMFHNPSKIAFNTNRVSVGLNYTPWLRNLVDDIFVGGVSYINRFREKSAWGIDFKYFSLGKIELTEEGSDGQPISTGTENPSELSLSGVYALKLSETFSMGVGLKYIRSGLVLRSSDTDLNAINSFAVDVSGYYRSPEKRYADFKGRYRLGFNITNIGPKVSYTPGDKDFIPTNLKLGGGFDFILDDYNTIGINLETTKLLVPTPPHRDVNGNITKGEDVANVGWISGIFQSFNDAPGGLSEEIREFTYAVGAEYLYSNAFALRGGYYHESKTKGNTQYFTMGGGFKAKAFSIDLSYLINSSDINHPLENTLRFSLSFDLGEIYEDY